MYKKPSIYIDMLKRLRHLFYCDTYKKLAKVLGVSVNLLYLWNAKDKVPDSALGLLKLIEKQQKEIQELKERKDGNKL